MPECPNTPSGPPTSGIGGTGPEVSDAETRISDALEALLKKDGTWRVIPSPGCLAVTRGWPDGSADTLIILSPETAYGRREDPGKRQVWQARGSVEEVVAAAREVAAPDAPDAPDDRDSAEPPGDWS